MAETIIKPSCLTLHYSLLRPPITNHTTNRFFSYFCIKSALHLRPWTFRIYCTLYPRGSSTHGRNVEVALFFTNIRRRFRDPGRGMDLVAYVTAFVLVYCDTRFATRSRLLSILNFLLCYSTVYKIITQHAACGRCVAGCRSKIPPHCVHGLLPWRHGLIFRPVGCWHRRT